MRVSSSLAPERATRRHCERRNPWAHRCNGSLADSVVRCSVAFTVSAAVRVAVYLTLEIPALDDDAADQTARAILSLISKAVDNLSDQSGDSVALVVDSGLLSYFDARDP